MSPPTTYTAEPLPGAIGLEGDSAPSLSWAKGQLMLEFGLTSTQARRMVVAFVEDQLDRARLATVHAEAVATGAFDDAREVVRSIFSAWCRRGDVIQTRSKVRREWAVSS